MTTALFNRRMRKTARPVVWEPWRAKSRQGHPIHQTHRPFEGCKLHALL